MNDKIRTPEGTAGLVRFVPGADSDYPQGAAGDLRSLVERVVDPSKDWPSGIDIDALVLRVRSFPNELGGPSEHAAHIRILEAIRLALTGHAEHAAADLQSFAEQGGRGESTDDLMSRVWEQSGKLFRMALNPRAALKAFRSARRARPAAAQDYAVHEARLVHREAEALGSLGRLEEATALLLEVEAAGLAIGDDMLRARALASRGSIAFENGQLAETVELYGRALAIADRLKSPSHTMIWTGYLGQAKLHQGSWHEAEVLLHRAIQSAKALFRSDAKSLFQSMLGTIWTYQGRPSEPETLRIFDEAIEDAKAFPLVEGAVRMHALHMRLAQVVERFLASELEGELSRSLAGITAESALISGRPNPGRGGRILVEDSDDVRLALRLLLRRIEDVRRERLSTHARVRVEVFSGARAFRVDGRIVSLLARPTLRKVLYNLVAGTSGGSPRTVGATALADAVWPGDADAKVKLNRLYVSLAELRELGLRGSLQKSSDGYFIEGSKLVGTRLPVGRTS